MKEQINPVFFDSYSDAAHQFYLKHGWVALTPQLTANELEQIKQGWEEMTRTFADEIGCGYQEYRAQISQWRDLWKHHPIFEKTLKHKALWEMAAHSFGQTNIRLLHDHIICKTPQAGNGEIPWHQDSMFWPVDRTGASTWMPLADTPIEAGCLEVIDGSHLSGAQEPVDFMSSPSEFSEDEILVKIPVNAGSIILLHSLTWHRSAPNQGTTARPAHITLWVPSETRFSPKQAEWHPLIEHIEVQAGELLNENWFPCFGEGEIGTGLSYLNNHSGADTSKQISMFGAREKVQSQIESFLNRKGSISALLHEKQARETLAKHISNSIEGTPMPEILGVVNAVWLSAAAYEQHRSRNVFNASYARWWQLMGEHRDIL